MKKLVTLAFTLVVSSLMLSACGKESAPKYKNANGQVVQPYVYPAPYGEQVGETDLRPTTQ